VNLGLHAQGARRLPQPITEVINADDDIS